MKELLYVANAGEDTISVISTKELREIKRISLNGGLLGPRRLLQIGDMLYYINSYASSVGRLELSTGKQTEVAVGAYPSGLCKCEDFLLVCCGETNNVYRIDCEKWRAEACAHSGVFPVGICPALTSATVNSAAQECALVCCLLSCEVLCIDAQLNQVTAYPLSSMPLDAIQWEGDIYLSSLETDGGGCIIKFDAQGKQTKRLSRCPAGRICPLGKQKKAVAAHLWDNVISIISLETLQVESTIATGAMPDDVVCDEDRIYVSCMLGDCIDVLQSNGKRVARIRVGREPRGLALATETPPFLEHGDSIS